MMIHWHLRVFSGILRPLPLLALAIVWAAAQASAYLPLRGTPALEQSHRVVPLLSESTAARISFNHVARNKRPAIVH